MTKFTSKRLFTLDQNKNQNLTINPYYVSGFSAAESSFIVRLRKMNSGKIGWQVSLSYQIGLHQKDLNFLKRIQLFFCFDS